MSEFESRSDDNLRARKKREVTGKDHRKTRAHALASQKLLPASSRVQGRCFRQVPVAQEAEDRVSESSNVLLMVAEAGHGR